MERCTSRCLSGLVVARAVLDLAFRTLNAFFAQFWSNLFALMQGVLDVVLVGVVLWLGYEMAGVLGSLLASAAIMAVVSAGYVWLRFDRLSSQDVAATPAPTGTGAGVSASTDDTPWLAGQSRRFVRFSLFTYAIGLLGFFTDVVFATLALALTLATEEVALFATAYKLSFMTIILGLTGFRGLYQPVFARLRIQNDSGQLLRVFSIVTRGQLVVLLPAGIGLMVMCGDYIPLLYGNEFQPAVPCRETGGPTRLCRWSWGPASGRWSSRPGRPESPRDPGRPAIARSTVRTAQCCSHTPVGYAGRAAAPACLRAGVVEGRSWNAPLRREPGGFQAFAKQRRGGSTTTASRTTRLDAVPNDTSMAAISAQAFIRHQTQRSTCTTPSPAPNSKLICHAWLMDVSWVMIASAIMRMTTLALLFDFDVDDSEREQAQCGVAEHVGATHRPLL